MNLSTEELRKLLEDCWDACEKYLSMPFNEPQRDAYITSQLSALQGKGKGVEAATYRSMLVDILLECEYGQKEIELVKRIANVFNKHPEVIIGHNIQNESVGILYVEQSKTTTLPPANQPTGISEINKARIIGLCEGVIAVWEQFGTKINIEGAVDVLIEIKGIVEKSTPLSESQITEQIELLQFPFLSSPGGGEVMKGIDIGYRAAVGVPKQESPDG